MRVRGWRCRVVEREVVEMEPGGRRAGSARAARTWRWRAMPWPARYLASASAFAWISVREATASASLIARILTASPSSSAATRRRRCLLISFIARFTWSSGLMSVIGDARIAKPNDSIDLQSCSWIECAISSLVVKTSSRSIFGTDERTTSKTYDSICFVGFVRR